MTVVMWGMPVEWDSRPMCSSFDDAWAAFLPGSNIQVLGAWCSVTRSYAL